MIDTTELVNSSELYAKEYCESHKAERNYSPYSVPSHFRQGAKWGYEKAVMETIELLKNNIAVCTPAVQRLLIREYKKQMLDK